MLNNFVYLNLCSTLVYCRNYHTNTKSDHIPLYKCNVCRTFSTKLFIHALYCKGLQIIYLLHYITRVALHCKGLQIIYSCIIWQAVIHLQFWAYGSWDSLIPISMSPHCKLMSPKHFFNDKSAILLHPGTR